MIWKPHYGSSINKPTVMRNVAIVALCILCAGVGTFAILRSFKFGQNTAQTTPSVEQSAETRTLEELKKSAFTKLQAGDQANGIKELEAALAQAKKSKDQNEVSYLEQQIDFAKNTPTSTSSKVPTSPQTLKDNPKAIRLVIPN